MRHRARRARGGEAGVSHEETHIAPLRFFYVFQVGVERVRDVRTPRRDCFVTYTVDFGAPRCALRTKSGRVWWAESKTRWHLSWQGYNGDASPAHRVVFFVTFFFFFEKGLASSRSSDRGTDNSS